jgi:cytochrome c-type biogenesis protein CcmH/NrfF
MLGGVTLGGLGLVSTAISAALPATVLPTTVLSATVLLSNVAHAETTAPDDSDDAKRAQDISRTVMSPFCPGRTLESCPSPYATEWREDIREWVAEGVSTEEIKKRLEARTPDKDLTGAPSTAMDRFLPALVSVVAIVLLVLLLRGLLRSNKNVAGPQKGGGARSDSEREQADDAAPGKAEPKTEETLERELDEELERLDD